MLFRSGANAGDSSPALTVSEPRYASLDAAARVTFTSYVAVVVVSSAVTVIATAFVPTTSDCGSPLFELRVAFGSAGAPVTTMLVVSNGTETEYSIVPGANDGDSSPVLTVNELRSAFSAGASGAIGFWHDANTTSPKTQRGIKLRIGFTQTSLSSA